MTNQHTPGPWHLRGTLIVNDDDAPYGIDIAQMLAVDAKSDAHFRRALRPEAAANARLIAAAPAMLDTLRDTLAHFESIIARIEDGARIYPADRNALDARFQQAHLVIDQATGIGQNVDVRA